MSAPPEGILIPPWEVAFCRRHSEPFRAAWPRGTLVVAVYAMQHVLSDPRFQAQAPKNAEGLIEVGSAINAAVRRVSPICCFLGDVLFAELTREALAEQPRRD